MNIIPQNCLNEATNLLEAQMLLELLNMEHDSEIRYTPAMYTKTVDVARKVVQIAYLDLIKNHLEKIDIRFKNSNERKRKYHIKSYAYRTILTLCGEVKIKRTFYISKETKENFCYLDRLMGLKKYEYCDPNVQGNILELSAEYSMSQAAKIMSDKINVLNPDNATATKISRQLVRNILMRSELAEPELERDEASPKSIYIMADEKYIHTQGNGKKNKMVKVAVIFEKIEEKNGDRNVLVGKHTLLSIGKDLPDKILKYLDAKYGLECIDTVFFSGDGANWINSLSYDIKPSQKSIVHRCLDSFHYNQALMRLTRDNDIFSFGLKLINKNDKKEFKWFLNMLKQAGKIETKKQIETSNYLINNFGKIQKTIKHNIKCPMESQISHTVASLLASRPKGYSLKTFPKLLKLRELHTNGYDIKSLFLKKYNEQGALSKKEKNINFDILEAMAVNNPLVPTTSGLSDQYTAISHRYS